MNRSEFAHGLHFDDHEIFHDDVEPVAAHQLSSILDLHGLFGFSVEMSVREFNAHRPAIYGLDETGSELSVHFDRGANHITDDSFGGQRNREMSFVFFVTLVVHTFCR